MPPVNPHTEEILGAIDGRIRPVSLSLGYRLSLVAVTAIMVLLPIAYVALVGALGYGLYFHIVNNQEALSGTWGKRLYFGTIIASVIALLFMIKPLFVRRPKAPTPLSAHPADEPLLHSFVEKLCHSVGAPVPARIDISSEVNASARLRRGFRSLWGKDLVLTIGTPLIASLSLKQLAGVLAHEFGHFSQNAGMKLTYVVAAINGWFARVAYERDSLDESLEEAARKYDFLWVSLLIEASRLLVWLTRAILRVFMWIGQAVSSSMMRQMEYDADRHSLRFAGLGAMESTLRELPRVRVAESGARSDMGSLWERGKLPADLPGLIASHRENLHHDLVRQIDEFTAEDTASLLSTHPSTSARIALAQAESEEGLFHCELPATALFSDFQGLSHKASARFYEMVLGPSFDPRALISLDEVDAHRQDEAAVQKSRESFFAGCLSVFRPLRVEIGDPIPQAQATLSQLRSATVDGSKQYDHRIELWSRQLERRANASAALALLDGGLTIDPTSFGMNRSDSVEALNLRASVNEKLPQLATEMQPFERVLEQRLKAALSLLESNDELQTLASCANALGEQLPEVCAIFEQKIVLGILLAKVKGIDEDKKSVKVLEETSAKVNLGLRQLRVELKGAPDILSEVHTGGGLGTYLVPDELVEGAHAQIEQAAELAMDRAFRTYFSAMGQLARFAESAEAKAGLEPLELLQEPSTQTS